MSFWADYVREIKSRNILEDENGFATYIFGEQCVHLEDVYVKPSRRKAGIGSEYMNRIIKKAKDKGYSKMLSSVCTDIPDPTTNVRIMLAVGFKVLNANKNIIYFIKEF